MTLHIKYDKVTTNARDYDIHGFAAAGDGQGNRASYEGGAPDALGAGEGGAADVLVGTAVSLQLPTPAEARAYRQGMAAYRRGDSITLQEYVDGMDRRPRRSRKKVS